MAQFDKVLPIALGLNRIPSMSEWIAGPAALPMLGKHGSLLSIPDQNRILANGWTYRAIRNFHYQTHWVRIRSVAERSMVIDLDAVLALQLMIFPDRAAIKEIQLQCRASGFNIKLDGIMGPKTLYAMASQRQGPKTVKLTNVSNSHTLQVLSQTAKANGMTDQEIRLLTVQVVAECGGRFDALERHRYSPDNAKQTFLAARSLTDDQIRQAARSRETFFEAMYGYHTSRGRNLGNTAPGDGGRYYGRGLIQTTGKANYRNFAGWSGLDVVSKPELIVSSVEISCLSAILYWVRVARSRMKITTIDEATKAVVGRYARPSTLAARRKIYEQYFT